MSAHHARLAAVEERQLRPIYGTYLLPTPASKKGVAVGTCLWGTSQQGHTHTHALFPTTEALDTGNVKSALTQCNKLLKKYPSPPTPSTSPTAPITPATTSRQLLTALKILALVRANKLDEASTLTTALLAETPTDENVLSTLAHSLKPLDRPKELVKMWVDAWSRAGKEGEEMKKKVGKKGGVSEVEVQAKLQHCEELGAQAFMAMVRTGHWAMAQQTAFKLYRSFSPKEGDGQVHPSIRYLYWSAISAVMQSQYPNPPPPVPVLVMIPPPAQVREWEESKKKEEEEDRKLLEQAGLTVDGTDNSSSISPSRRKKRAFALSLAKRLIDMTMDQRDKEIGAARSMNADRFWLWGEVLRRVADAAVDDENSGLVPKTNKAPFEQYTPASQVLTTPIASRFAGDSLHVEELRADIAKKSEDWKRECEGMARRLDLGDRNWRTFTTFFDALFHFLPNSGASTDTDTYPCLVQMPKPAEITQAEETTPSDDAKSTDAETKPEEEKEKKDLDVNPTKEPFTLSFTRAFLRRLADSDEAAGPGKERAGLLGVLELEKRVRKMPELSAAEDAPDYVDLLTSYFERFGSKPVIVEDLLGYVLDTEEGSEERKKWDAFLEGMELKTDTIDSLQTTINILKLQRQLASSDKVTFESELAFAKKCAGLYHAGLHLGKNIATTELQPADDMAVLAATALIHAHHISMRDAVKEGSTVDTKTLHAPLLDVLVLLEQTVTTSRWAYTPRLILTRLYRLLAAPSLALQHYTLANLKSIQFDTLSHHVLSRASTFSLSCIGDLSLVTECVESSQIYSVNGVDTSEQLVKAFQQERYSQIADFVLLEERVDNSLQRDLTKLEHFRMKNLHEGLAPENVEVELVELRFVWGRVHYDNRDFDLLPSYQPQGASSLDDMTSVGGTRLSQQWFNTMLKLWILILHQSSEQLWTEDEQRTVLGPVSTFSEADLAHLTEPERLLITYCRALLSWLAPHHAPLKHAVMTNAVSVLSAAKAKHAASQSTSTSNASSTSAPVKAKASGRKANGLSNGTEGTASSSAASGGDGLGVKVGDTRVITGMLTLHEPMEVPPIPTDIGEAVKEPPAELDGLLDQFSKLFDDTLAKPTALPWEYLHVAQLIHEVTFITHLLTARFALSSSKKKAHPTYKPLRAKSVSILEHVAKGMTKLGEECEFNAEVRKAWLHDRRSSGVLEEHTDEQVVSVGRGLMESRKKIYDGLGKGMTKALQSVAKAAGGVPVGTV